MSWHVWLRKAMCIRLDEAPSDVQVPCNAFVTCRWSSASGCVGLDADVLQKPCFALRRDADLRDVDHIASGPEEPPSVPSLFRPLKMTIGQVSTGNNPT